MSVDLSGYIDVSERIAEFRTKHPEGSLQPADPANPFRVLDIQGQAYVAVVAAAYRTPDDTRPGIGMAYEVFPGKTPYTRGSELQNAETSAWGRAIVAALAADTRRGIASADEVRNRQDEWEQAAKPPTVEELKNYNRWLGRIEQAENAAQLQAIGRDVLGGKANSDITPVQYDQLARRAAAKLAELQRAGDGGPNG